ncbi:MAG: lipocalin family protein [Aliishimia sp.]
MKQRFGITRGLRALGFGVVGLLVVACSGPSGPVSYRDQSKIIAATTRFNVEQFWGNWQVRQAYAGDANLRTVSLLPDPRGGVVWQEQRQRCEGTVCVLDQTTNSVLENGKGRLLASPGQREFWVLWVDADFRTAAVGTPDGRFGYILDRQKTGGADRIKAARDILDFNGYDVTQLQVIQ